MPFINKNRHVTYIFYLLKQTFSLLKSKYIFCYYHIAGKKEHKSYIFMIYHKPPSKSFSKSSIPKPSEGLDGGLPPPGDSDLSPISDPNSF